MKTSKRTIITLHPGDTIVVETKDSAIDISHNERGSREMLVIHPHRGSGFLGADADYIDVELLPITVESTEEISEEEEDMSGGNVKSCANCEKIISIKLDECPFCGHPANHVPAPIILTN